MLYEHFQNSCTTTLTIYLLPFFCYFFTPLKLSTKIILDECKNCWVSNYFVLLIWKFKGDLCFSNTQPVLISQDFFWQNVNWVENVLNCQLFHLISLHYWLFDMLEIKRLFCAQLIESLKLSQAKQIFSLLRQFWLYRHNHMNRYSIVYK